MAAHGELSRQRILDAIVELLPTQSLDQMSIVGIATKAGLTRSGFYFYFPTKGAAVAALMDDLFTEFHTASISWYTGSAPDPLAALYDGMTETVRLWRERAVVFHGVVQAAAVDAEAQALWRRWMDDFTDRVAQRIAEEAGKSAHVVAPSALAAVLVGATFSALERDVREIMAGRPPDPGVAGTLTFVWAQTLYAPKTRWGAFSPAI